MRLLITNHSFGGSEEDLKERELQAKQNYEEKCASYQKHQELAQVICFSFVVGRSLLFLQNLKSSLNTRRQRWNKFKEHITMRARTSFTYLLSERQFRGNLVINHSQKELDIHVSFICIVVSLSTNRCQVEPDITRKSDKGRQTKTLSGGEKSFSTICLLLALWEAMGSPIRCLDEL
jgi:hypothetical protein